MIKEEVIDGIHKWVYLGKYKSINWLSINGYSISMQEKARLKLMEDWAFGKLKKKIKEGDFTI